MVYITKTHRRVKNFFTFFTGLLFIAWVFIAGTSDKDGGYTVTPKAHADTVTDGSSCGNCGCATASGGSSCGCGYCEDLMDSAYGGSDSDSSFGGGGSIGDSGVSADVGTDLGGGKGGLW